jgi:hypothetical protein
MQIRKKDGVDGHKFERDPSRHHPCQVWFNLVQRFQRRSFKCDLLSKYRLKEKFHQKNGIYVKLPVNISHFNLLRNHWANCNQTLVEWSLDGPLPKLCPVMPTSNRGCRTQFERDPPWDHPCQVWFNLVQRFQRRRFKCDLSSKYA